MVMKRGLVPCPIRPGEPAEGRAIRQRRCNRNPGEERVYERVAEYQQVKKYRQEPEGVKVWPVSQGHHDPRQYDI
jgi:hypothetical protein